MIAVSGGGMARGTATFVLRKLGCDVVLRGDRPAFAPHPAVTLVLDYSKGLALAPPGHYGVESAVSGELAPIEMSRL